MKHINAQQCLILLFCKLSCGSPVCGIRRGSPEIPLSSSHPSAFLPSLLPSYVHQIEECMEFDHSGGLRAIVAGLYMYIWLKNEKGTRFIQDKDKVYY